MLTTGLVTLSAFILYVSAFAVGPGVCVHLALSGFMVLFFCLVTVFLPETKGKSLEEIERMFAK